LLCIPLYPFFFSEPRLFRDAISCLRFVTRLLRGLSVITFLVDPSCLLILSESTSPPAFLRCGVLLCVPPSFSFTLGENNKKSALFLTYVFGSPPNIPIPGLPVICSFFESFFFCQARFPALSKARRQKPLDSSTLRIPSLWRLVPPFLVTFPSLGCTFPVYPIRLSLVLCDDVPFPLAACAFLQTLFSIKS